MKNPAILLLLLFANLIFGNKIDKLKTTKDVVKFVKAIYPEYGIVKYKNFARGVFDIKPIDTVYNSIRCQDAFTISEIKSWQKIDINNDGLTDLIFISHHYGYTQNIIIDKGRSKFNLIRNIVNFDECEYIKPIRIENKNELLVRNVSLPFDIFPGDKVENYIKKDTLTYKFDALIERNSSPFDSKIKSVTLKTNLCSGICPVYELTVNKNGYIEFNGIEQVEFTGKSTKQVNPKEVVELFNLMNYIEIRNLKDYYEANYTDAETLNLTVFFEDGTVKNIKDYGASGTYGLSALYAKLKRLATETHWK